MKSMGIHKGLRIGTRASPMARAMADTIKNVIAQASPHVETHILAFVAEGDRIEGSLQKMGGKGTFIKDLERRLLAHEIDCAVHSLKDIPGDLPAHEDLALVAYLPREDPRDALILRQGITLESLVVTGGVIGSSSPRREASLRRLYPGVNMKLCRGNVNSRLQKLDDGQFDGIVLSYAGLKRLGFAQRASYIYSQEEMLPAVGQGIMALQVRKVDLERCPFLRSVNNEDAEIAAKVERAMLFRLQGNCHSAIAGYCSMGSDQRVVMRGAVYNQATGDFVASIREASLNQEIDRLGNDVAEDLLSKGARALMAA